MATQDLLQYIRERVIERLVERVPDTTEEEERAWFDATFEAWVRAHRPADAEDTAASEYRTPEGESLHRMEIQFEGVAEERIEEAANVPEYDPPPLRKTRSADVVRLWMEAAYEPWPDLPLERAARVFSGRLGYSVPRSPLTHETCQLGWAHFSETEARALAFELHRAGVDVEALMAQIEAFPYPDVSLAWLTEPESSLHMHTRLVDQMDEEERAAYPESLARLRHTAEFIARVAELIPPHVRTWLQGWSAVYVHAAFAHAVGLAPKARGEE